MRIAIVYDCLFPWRIGGAERWYRSLAEELVRRGHDVVYLTRREWDEEPSLPFEVVGVSGRGEEIYSGSGRRRVGPTLRFGFGVWRYLRTHREVDLVHAGSFPFFSIFGARAARLGPSRPPLMVDVVEVWSFSYWLAYAGPIAGCVGWLVDRLALRLADVRFTFTRQQQRQLAHFKMEVLPGLFDGRVADRPPTSPGSPCVLFVGRLISDKGVHVIPKAIAIARRRLPQLRCQIIGDGPERARLEAEIDRLGLRDAISPRGFVSDAELREAISSSACVLLPSSREGYGLVVVEAAALGTPTLTLRHDHNAAATLIEPGVNGWLVNDLDPEQWASAIVAAVEAAPIAKQSAWEWGKVMADGASVKRSVDVIASAYVRALESKMTTDEFS